MRLPGPCLALLFATTALCVRAAFADEPSQTSSIKPARAESNSESSLDPEHVRKAAQSLELFKTQVKPLLVKHCLDCHGGKSIKADFDLTTREKLLASGYVEKTAEESHLFQLVIHAEEPFMPAKAPRLSDEEIGVLKQWIDLGFVYDAPLVEQLDQAKEKDVTESDREFWAFRPLGGATIPDVVDSDWSRTEIDRFIFSAQASRGLHPNREADRLTLIRRASLDLIGMPPSPDQVDAFLKDPDPQAYDRLVDRLLESPQFGERWARHWIDIARFAESHGYEQDYDRPHAYHYRDFLIRAFNADMPYDQFVQWQLAGDELAPDNPNALMATGFLGAGAFPTQLTEDEFEKARYDELDDMTATTGVAFLGLSVGCARCHDHKYDPIPSRDYYRMAACFSSAIRSEIELDLSPEENRKRRDNFELVKSQLEQALANFERGDLQKQFREWIATFDPMKSINPWEVLDVESVRGDAGTTFLRQPDGSWLASGSTPERESITVSVQTTRQAIRSLRIEAMAHDSLPAKGPGRAGNGNFVLGDFKVQVTDASGSRDVALTNPRATHQQNEGDLSIMASLDSNPVTGWAVDGGGIGHDQAAVFDLVEPVGTGGQTTLIITMAFLHPNPHHLLGRFRLSLTDLADQAPVVGGNGPDTRVREALLMARSQPDPNSSAWKLALEYYKSISPEWQERRRAIDTHLATGAQPILTKVMVTSEGFPHLPHHADGRGFPHFYPEMYLLKRGDIHQKIEKVDPGFLRVLMPSSGSSDQWKVLPPENWTRTRYSRTSLAKWIMDPVEGAGQLAARVMVNRIWQHHFGRGIVSTPSDFGFQGERPTHPALLDHLARQLIDGGWKMKRLHREIMLSATYRQATDFDESRATIDRENLMLWRMSPQRLEAEPIRDSLLAVSGQLDPTMFGAGTLDQNMTRRSIYFFIKRSQLIPMMMLFDWPEHLVSIGQRSNTTVAPQALLLMNSPQGRRYATGLVERLDRSTREISIAQAYRLCFGRTPSDSELSVANRFLMAQELQYQAANHLHPEQTALIDLCQALLASSEFVYRP